MFGRMKDPVEGTATLVSYVETNARNEFDVVLIAQVVVQAEGLPPTAVEANPGIPLSQMPVAPGTVLRVRVDRKNPKHLKFLLGEADEDADAQVTAGRAQAEQIAANMRGESPPPPSPPNS
jgi:hypothetical protein